MLKTIAIEDFIMSFDKKFPHVAKDISLNASATLIGTVYVADNCKIGSNCELDASVGRIVLRTGCTIGESTLIRSIEDQRLVIEKNTVIGMNCIIYGSVGEETVIEDGVEIVSGVSIGANCIIKHGLVVDKNQPDHTKLT